MKVFKKIMLFLLLVFLVMQFIRPEKNTSETVAATDLITVLNPPTEISLILKNSCYDCHSNNTRYPWYSQIAPVSYWLSDHIKEGKKHLNFSQWESYAPKRKAHKMEELVEEVKGKTMPLESYLWMHHDANLTEEEIAQLVSWADGLRLKYELEEQQLGAHQ